MIANAEKSSRMWTLAEQATAAVGDTTAFLQVIRGANVSMEGDLCTQSGIPVISVQVTTIVRSGRDKG
jgi:hypothetical protein